MSFTAIQILHFGSFIVRASSSYYTCVIVLHSVCSLLNGVQMHKWCDDIFVLFIFVLNFFFSLSSCSFHYYYYYWYYFHWTYRKFSMHSTFAVFFAATLLQCNQFRLSFFVADDVVIFLVRTYLQLVCHSCWLFGFFPNTYRNVCTLYWYHIPISVDIHVTWCTMTAD